jgi:hypothetical protein
MGEDLVGFSAMPIQSRAMTRVPSPDLSSLASRLLARRHEQLVRELNESKNAVAADFARIHVASPAVAKQTATAWCEAFLKYGADVTQQLLDLRLEGEKCLNSNTAEWVRVELHQNLDRTSSGMSAAFKELAGGRAVGHDLPVGTTDALIANFSRDISRALVSAKVDVDIAVDRAVLENGARSAAAPSPDPALIDALTALPFCQYQ